MATQEQESTAPAASKPFRFMDLPPELRNMIYSILLENDTPLYIQYKQEYVYVRKNNVRPAILRTRRQIRLQATSILYGNNLFVSLDTAMLRRFFLMIGPNVQHIRKFKVTGAVTRTGVKRLLVSLKRAESLQRLILGASVVARYDARLLYTCLRPVMRALHRAREQKKGYHVKSVLDLLIFELPVKYRLTLPLIYDTTPKSVKMYEQEVKDLLRKVLE